MNNKQKNYYEILQVSTDASLVEIKRAYRKLVKTRHPDLDHANKSEEEIYRDNELMLQINEAYEILKDKKSRAQYDVQIGLTLTIVQAYQLKPSHEDEDRKFFLSTVFFPSYAAINKVLGRYKKQLRELSQDPFDDNLIEAFSCYVDELEKILRKCSVKLSKHPAPESLEATELMMRHSLAQAVDGLDELRHYCQNFDYDHLACADNLFKIATNLLKQALDLTKTRR